MKIEAYTKKKNAGSALFYTVILLVLVAGYLASYLMLTQNEYASVARSQVWNAAMVNAEAGVEEALAVANINVGSFNKISTWVTSATNNGWTTDISYRSVYAWSKTNSIVYRMIRTNSNAGTAIGAGRYEVYISTPGTNTGPEIFSIGYANWGNSITSATNAVRKIYVQTKNDALINANLSALTTIDMSGNNVTADSFDSGDGYHSVWNTNLFYKGTNYGVYSTTTNWPNTASGDPSTDPLEPLHRKDNAIVATDGSVINVNNANIYGYVNTAPGGTVVFKSNGTVGDYSWAGASTPGIQPGHESDDMNVAFPDVQLPDTNGSPWVDVTKRNGNGNSPTSIFNYGSTNVGGPYPFYYVISNGVDGGTTNYRIASQLTSSVLIKGTNIILYLPAGATFNSSDLLFLETNSDVTIYTGGDISTKGNSSSGINNISQMALAFSIFGLNGCSKIDLGGNPTITSYIYAPHAALSLVGGGGSTYYDAVGAFFVNSIKMTGNMNFHYDEQFRIKGPTRGYIPVIWREIY